MGYDERSGMTEFTHAHAGISGHVGNVLGERTSIALYEQALQALVSILCSETGAERVHLTLLQNETPYMVVLAGGNERCDLNAAPLFERVAKRREPVFIDSGSPEHASLSLFSVPEVASIASFPISDRRKALAGVLTIFSAAQSWSALSEAQKGRAQELQFITERLIEARLNADRLSDYLEIATDWVWEQDQDLRLTYSSIGDLGRTQLSADNAPDGPRWDTITGRVTDPGRLAAHKETLKDPRPFRDFRYSIDTGDETVCVSIHGWPIYAPDGRFLGYRGIGRDVTEEERAKKQIAYYASHDPLTGLVNRAAFTAQLERTFCDWTEHGDPAALLLLDLDNFKTLNDTYGHSFGDAILKEVAHRLGSIVSHEATIARLGGDEFAILDPALIRRSAVTECAGAMISALNTPATIDGKQVRFGCSIGVALLPQHGADGNQLLGNADLALYAAKRAGRNRFRFFEHTMRYELEDADEQRRAMRFALPRNEISVAFRSIRSLSDDRITGAEAVLVWTPAHATPIRMRALGSPLAQADEALEIGTHFLRRAAGQLADWNRRAGVSRTLSLTLNPAQCEDPNLVANVIRIEAETGLGLDNLQLNLFAESVLRHSGELKSNLAALLAKGVTIGITEYGHQLVSPFKLLPLGISRVNLDLDALRRVDDSADAWATAKALTRFARDMGFSVCTSGYDRHADHEQLLNCGGDTYISRPIHHALDADAFTERLFSIEKQTAM